MGFINQLTSLGGHHLVWKNHQQGDLFEAQVTFSSIFGGYTKQTKNRRCREVGGYPQKLDALFEGTSDENG